MEQPFDSICETEEALQGLEILARANESEPQLATELRRLEARLRRLYQAQPVFAESA